MAAQCSSACVMLGFHSVVLMGTMLPFGLAKAGVDPANAGTSVQVSFHGLCGDIVAEVLYVC